MGSEQTSGAKELTAEERQQLRRAHERLRTASKELEVLVATEPIKNRWTPEPAPPEILEAARSELQTAWAELALGYRELLGWDSAA